MVNSLSNLVFHIGALRQFKETFSTKSTIQTFPVFKPLLLCRVKRAEEEVCLLTTHCKWKLYIHPHLYLKVRGSEKRKKKFRLTFSLVTCLEIKLLICESLQRPYTLLLNRRVTVYYSPRLRQKYKILYLHIENKRITLHSTELPLKLTVTLLVIILLSFKETEHLLY